MTSPETVIIGAIRAVLRERADHIEVHDHSNLFDDLELDSLELAELSGLLEDHYGRDPFSAGLAPSTVAEVTAFYTD